MKREEIGKAGRAKMEREFDKNQSGGRNCEGYHRQ